MNIREQELIEEIESLKTKLAHAENWMQRQVQESSHEGRHFFEHRKKASFFESITKIFDKFTLMRFFHKKPTRFDLWKSRLEAFLVGAAIILFWRGIWELADLYLFPQYPTYSALMSLLVGV